MKCKPEPKKIQHAEMKALKKGGAPKSVIQHEKREHAAMNKKGKK